MVEWGVAEYREHAIRVSSEMLYRTAVQHGDLVTVCMRKDCRVVYGVTKPGPRGSVGLSHGLCSACNEKEQQRFEGCCEDPRTDGLCCTQAIKKK